MKKERSLARKVFASAIVICVLVALAVVVGVSRSSSGTKAAAQKVTVAKVSSTCWVVHLDANVGAKMLSNGIPVSARGSAQKTESFLLNVAKQDPQELQALYNARAQVVNQPQLPVNFWQNWVTGNCYNAAGKNAWFLTATNYQLASVGIASAPAVGCNYYMSSSGPTCQVETINGDRTGIAFTFSNGQTIYVMYHCGNPVIPGGTPAPPLAPACPPGQFSSPVVGTTCIEAKNPTADPLVNVVVTPIVKGPGTTPPGGTPPPPKKPIDSPTGCQGSCSGPTTTTTTPSTTTTAPPSSSGASQPPGTTSGPGPVTPPSSS
jgi:hypothetical protein